MSLGASTPIINIVTSNRALAVSTTHFKTIDTLISKKKKTEHSCLRCHAPCTVQYLLPLRTMLRRARDLHWSRGPDRSRPLHCTEHKCHQSLCLSVDDHGTKCHAHHGALVALGVSTKGHVGLHICCSKRSSIFYFVRCTYILQACTPKSIAQKARKDNSPPMEASCKPTHRQVNTKKNKQTYNQTRRFSVQKAQLYDMVGSTADFLQAPRLRSRSLW